VFGDAPSATHDLFLEDGIVPSDDLAHLVSVHFPQPA
jgi:hypothetical protein